MTKLRVKTIRRTNLDNILTKNKGQEHLTFTVTISKRREVTGSKRTQKTMTSSYYKRHTTSTEVIFQIKGQSKGSKDYYVGQEQGSN